MTQTDHRVITSGAAEQDAVAAARAAGVVVRSVAAVAELRDVAGLFARVWDAPDVPPMPHDLMRSLVHAGGAVHAAYRDGRLTGAAVAVFGPPAGASCYSLIAGVSPDAASRGTGFALKLAQRSWALAAGADSMRWTFDPLLRRNARFNLTRLGAGVTGYLTDFYGEIADGVNDPETDRLAVAWDLRAPLPSRPATAAPATPPAPPAAVSEPASEAASQPAPASASASAPASAPGPAPQRPPAVLAIGPAGEPVPGDTRAPRVGCWIPADILALRHADPDLARRWRLAVRAALGGALHQGYRVTGLADPGWYVLEREGAGA